ncbi:MAG: hypothetical protein H7Y32_10910, partial [Chloroflexales bacterium]|nr:hypothetical protein [Chloroflexales bacterium]
MSADDAIEPGILPIFRLFTGTMCIVQGLRVLGMRARGESDLFALGMFCLMGLLFAYLSGSWLRATLGRPYLPLALLVAAVGPIVADMAQQLAGTASPARTALIEPARLYFWLLPPLVIVSAQYDMRALLLFTLGTALLPVLLLLSAGAERALLLNVATNAGARLFLFPVAGFLIGRISGAQRAQRHEL